MENRFFVCEHCDNRIAMMHQVGPAVQCCGEKMKEITPGTSDGAEEKHLPVWDVQNGKVTVTVGEVEYPMTPEHYIEWVCLETEDGLQYKGLQPNMAPRVSFLLSENDQMPFATSTAFGRRNE